MGPSFKVARPDSANLGPGATRPLDAKTTKQQAASNPSVALPASESPNPRFSAKPAAGSLIARSWRRPGAEQEVFARTGRKRFGERNERHGALAAVAAGFAWRRRKKLCRNLGVRASGPPRLAHRRARFLAAVAGRTGGVRGAVARNAGGRRLRLSAHS